MIVARVAFEDFRDNPNAVADACAKWRTENDKPSDYVLFVEEDPSPSARFINIEDVT